MSSMLDVVINRKNPAKDLIISLARLYYFNAVLGRRYYLQGKAKQLQGSPVVM
jgi:hypothetical protein